LSRALFQRRFVILPANSFKYHRFFVFETRKYLVFLGWCILGVQGQLALEDGGDGIPTNGLSLENQGIYYYVADVGGKFSSTVLPTRY
jgi:hypothetical protein